MTPHSRATIPVTSAKSRSTWEVLRRVAVYLRPYPWMAGGTILCAVLSLAASFAFPKLGQFAVDVVIQQRRTDLLAPVMLGLIGALLLRDFFNSLRILCNNHLEQRVILDLRRDVYARLQRMPVDYFDQRASGDLMTRVVEDVNSVERVLIDGTEQGTVALLSVVGVAVMLFWMNPWLAAVAMMPLPLLAGGAMWYTVTAHRRYRRHREAASALNSLLMDNLQGVRQIKAFGREAHEDARFAGRADTLRQMMLRIVRVWAVYSPAMSFLGGLGVAVLLWVGGRMVLRDAMKIGELVAFMLYLRMFYAPMGQLHALNQMLQAARAAGERVFDILDAPVERAGRGAGKLLAEPVRGEVVYENVGFSYGPGADVLKNINLHAKPGEMIAIVGPTGAGKSTLVNLLPAFYEPTAGRITIDGQELSGLALSTLRQHISVVSQEAFLFNGTVRENILYGRLDATEAELHAAAKAAHADEFIARLPERFDTKVGERGVKLSVGEKQRISIARALLKNAPILVLDEATASVDTATERLIQDALERLLEGRTSFVIAHRFSTIQRANQILVMRRGEIVERGTKEELLALGGLYAKLAGAQKTATVEERFESIGEAG